MMHEHSIPDENPTKKPWSPLWVAALLGALMLLLVFVASSIDLVRVAIKSQPECVAHERLGESQSIRTMAAKSSC